MAKEKTLFSVTTEDHDEDWFIVASSEQEASEFHLKTWKATMRGTQLRKKYERLNTPLTRKSRLERSENPVFTGNQTGR